MKMMIKPILLVFFLLLSVNSLAQDTISIKKKEVKIYRGQESEIVDWFIYYKNGVFFMCSLPGKSKETALTWFEKRKDSQNIYKAVLEGLQYETLSFSKENDIGQKLSFYYQVVEKNLILISTTDGAKYTFKRL